LRLLIGVIVIGALVSVTLRFAVLPHFDASRNAVINPGPYVVSHHVLEFHRRSFVADLHADPLLWRRDLTSRQTHGQVDLPRLLDGGVDLQVFSVVSKVPDGANYKATSADSDKLPILFIASWRPPSAWFSPKQRALVQAAEMKQLVQQTTLTQVLRRDDILHEGVKGLLSLEGMHALEGDADTLTQLHAAGFRMMGLAHHFDNEVAGSAHGTEQYGLTALGRSLLPQMEALGITIDLAHASTAAFEETLAMAVNPVVVSHGGVDGTCPGPRNLSDGQLRSIAANGGVVGIGYWKGAVCDASVAGIVAAIRYAIDIAGINHVGLGSDFDGHVTTPFDTTGIPMLTAALLDSGLSESEVAKVLGENVKRVLMNNLPQ
jgi:membrane dipeptidase